MPIKIFEDELRSNARILELVHHAPSLIGLGRILSIIYLNTTRDTIPQDIFDNFVVGVLLHDDTLPKLEQTTGIGLPLALYRILRYNLIFKKNVYSYAKKQAAAKTMDGNTQDFKTLMHSEMKQLLDKIYLRERLMSYKVNMARAHAEALV